jgi:hypothetical protein
MKTRTTTRRGNRRIYAAWAATALVATLLSSTSLGVQATAQSPDKGNAHPEASCEGAFVIQGRITKIEGGVVTVKTPDVNPPVQQGRPLYVVAGSKFRVDVSSARTLMPDGKTIDKQPLAAHEHVLMVLSGTAPEPGPGNPGSAGQIYSASVIERLTQSDVIELH